MIQLTNKNVLEEVKKLPHWEFIFRPIPFIENRIENLSLCFSNVASASVSLRGWPFPLVNEQSDYKIIRDSSIGTWNNFWGHIEYWQSFLSGQFYYIGVITERYDKEWYNELKTSMKYHLSHLDGLDKVPGYLSIVNTVYRCTEFFEFATRFCKNSELKDNVQIIISLKNIEGYALGVDRNRAWWGFYNASQNQYSHKINLSIIDLISKSKELALDTAYWIFQRFGWLEPNIKAMAEDQNKLLLRKF